MFNYILSVLIAPLYMIVFKNKFDEYKKSLFKSQKKLK